MEIFVAMPLLSMMLNFFLESNKLSKTKILSHSQIERSNSLEMLSVSASKSKCLIVKLMKIKRPRMLMSSLLQSKFIPHNQKE